MRFAMMCVAVLFLTACDSVEERAEKYYESGVALLESGEPEKALLELRNVFDLNSSHHDARALYAKTARELGRTREAYGQYLRLVEQYPDDVEGRVSLAQMAFESQNWEEFERHGKSAVDLAATDPRVEVIKVGLDYRDAVTGNDVPAREQAVLTAKDLSEKDENSPILQAVLIDGYTVDGQYDKALSEIDRVLAAQPANRAYQNMRLGLMVRMEDAAGTEQQLVSMVSVFPDDQTIKDMLIRYYIGEGQTDKAESFMRSFADPEAEDLDPFFRFISLLLQTKGPDAARAELEKGLEANPDSIRIRTGLAGIDFGQGRKAEAIARLESLLEGAEPSEQTRGVQVTLARMLLEQDNEVGARRLVEEVLAADPGQSDALKLQAEWLIQADDVDGAVAALRRALDNNPDDVDAMSLMAAAYTRGGSHELARDFLSLAAEASGNRPAESIRYARSLLDDGRTRPAEDALLAALRGAPNNVSLLLELGRLYLTSDQPERVRQTIDTLKRLDNPAATSAAVGLEAALVSNTQSFDQVLDFLKSAESNENTNLAAKTVLMQTYLAAGQPQQALAVADEALAENPQSPQFRFLKAMMQAANGDLAGAETGLRAITRDEPKVPQFWMELSRVLAAQSKPEEALQAINDGRAANPGDPSLQWAMASALQKAGDIDGAIEIYEDLYETTSDSVIVANNLASLLSSYRSDDESQERAFVIARRLRDTEQPAFQDTYGWILYQRGDYEEALRYLEPAAEGLSGDALVQYHLAKTYLAMERPEDALQAFRKAVAATSDIDTRPQIEEARQEIGRLQTQ
jgi:tetratricopeptide (TPR) repeat protein